MIQQVNKFLSKHDVSYPTIITMAQGILYGHSICVFLNILREKGQDLYAVLLGGVDFVYRLHGFLSIMIVDGIFWRVIRYH